METERFTRLFSSFQLLVGAQRIIWLLLRAAWLLGAGFLLVWGLHRFLDKSASATIWGWLALLTAGLTLMVMLSRWPRRAQLAWRADRLLDLKEQTSTAWMVVQDSKHHPLSDALLEDASNQLLVARKRVTRRGWALQRELEALLVIVLLFTLIRINNSGSRSPIDPEAFTLAHPSVAALPTSGAETDLSDIFPAGIPGLKDPAVGNTSLEIGDPQPPEEIEAIAGALQTMGSTLSELAPSHEFGESLNQMDMNAASLDLGGLAEQIPSLTGETRDEIGSVFGEASAAIDQASASPMAQEMSSALQGAEIALNFDASITSLRERFDRLGQALQDFGEVLAAQQQTEPGGDLSSSDKPGDQGAGSGSGEQGRGAAESFPRLEGEGEDFTLLEDSEQPGALTSGNTSQPGQETTVSGTLSVLNPDAPWWVSSILTPFHFPWEWQNVVSSYFSPQGQ